MPPPRGVGRWTGNLVGAALNLSSCDAGAVALGTRKHTSTLASIAFNVPCGRPGARSEVKATLTASVKTVVVRIPSAKQTQSTRRERRTHTVWKGSIEMVDVSVHLDLVFHPVSVAVRGTNVVIHAIAQHVVALHVRGRMIPVDHPVDLELTLVRK